MNQIRPDRLPLPVNRGKLHEVRLLKNDYLLASTVVSHPVDVAVAIIDNLDPLSAAIVFDRVLLQSERKDPRHCNCTQYHAEQIVRKARALEIQGSLGLCYARDLVYNRTGDFTIT